MATMSPRTDVTAWSKDWGCPSPLVTAAESFIAGATSSVVAETLASPEIRRPAGPGPERPHIWKSSFQSFGFDERQTPRGPNRRCPFTTLEQRQQAECMGLFSNPPPRVIRLLDLGIRP